MSLGTNDLKIKSDGKLTIHIDDTPMHHVVRIDGKGSTETKYFQCDKNFLSESRI